MRWSVRDVGKSFFDLVKDIGKRWWFHSYSKSAAALAFYSLFSMVPILVIVTGLAAAFIGEDMAEDSVGDAAGMLFDEKSGNYLQELLSARPDEAFTGVSSIVGFFVLMFTASKVVVELRDALGLVFGRRAREGRRGVIIDLVMGQVIPILLVFALGAVLVISALTAAALKIVAANLTEILPADLALWEWAQRTLPLIFEALLFAAILKWLPPNPPRFRSAITGACVTCILLAMLRSLIGFYFSQSSVTTAYGAAVTLVVVLLWIYFTIQIFFIGAETAGYMERQAKAADMEEEDIDG